MTPARQLASFLAKFEPAVARTARGALARLEKRLPGAHRLVYDNYNALAIAFGPSEKTSTSIISVAVFPRWVSVFFLQAAGMKDPQRILKGNGKRVRHIVLKEAADLDTPAVRALVEEALRVAAEPLGTGAKGKLMIKSVSAKQRPR